MKAWIVNLSLILISSALTLTVAYLILDKTGHIKTLMLKSGGIQKAETIAYVYDNRVGWRLNPHTEIHRSRPGAFDVRLRTNADGFMDREHTLQSENYRVALVGDSFVEAQQVDERSRFSSVLEDMVFTLSEEQKSIETLNFGVSNHGTSHSYGVIKHWVRNYKPNEVWVFFYSGNDYGDNNPIFTPPPLGPNYKFVDSKENELADITFGFELPRAKTHAVMKKQYGSLMNSYSNFFLEVAPFVYSQSSNPMMNLSLARTDQSFRLIKKMLDKNSIKMRIIYIPVDREVDESAWKTFVSKVKTVHPDLELNWDLSEQKIASMAKSMGVNFHSLRPLIMSHGVDKMYFDHFTPYGHAQVGIELAKLLLKDL